MISEPQQEQAALYALGLLDADEAAAFERELPASAELSDFVRELRDTVASLAWLDPVSGAAAGPSPDLRARILRIAETENAGLTAPAPATASGPAVEAKIIRPRFGWLPWAVAALFMGCSAWLGMRLAEQRRDFDSRLASAENTIPVDALSRVSFCQLEPTPELDHQPHAAVLWDPAQQRGVLRVKKLPPPAQGKDYELWTVEAGRKDSISAGLVHVDAAGDANISFRPSVTDGKPVVALAISLEQAGGSPTNQGPILLLGKL